MEKIQYFAHQHHFESGRHPHAFLQRAPDLRSNWFVLVGHHDSALIMCGHFWCSHGATFVFVQLLVGGGLRSAQDKIHLIFGQLAGERVRDVESGEQSVLLEGRLRLVLIFIVGVYLFAISDL